MRLVERVFLGPHFQKFETGAAHPRWWQVISRDGGNGGGDGRARGNKVTEMVPQQQSHVTEKQLPLLPTLCEAGCGVRYL